MRCGDQGVIEGDGQVLTGEENVTSIQRRLLAGLGAVLMVAGCSDSPTNPSPQTPPGEPDYSIVVSGPTLTIAQGGGSLVMTLYVVRTNFSGGVTLSVENLPIGVSADFYPGSSTYGSSSLLYLTVAGDAAIGRFANVLVRGVAFGLPDRTASIPLTITEAPFLLTLSSPALSIAQDAAQSTTVNVVRNNYTGPVMLVVDGDGDGRMVPGVTAEFAPSPTSGNSSVLSLTMDAAAVPGVYELFVYGYGSTGLFWYAELTLTVLSP